MATTAAEILLDLQAEGYGSDTEAPQLRMLNRIHKRVINARRWAFLFGKDTTKTLTVGTAALTYDALAEARYIDAVRLEIGTTYYDLEFLNTGRFRALEHTDRATGTPEYWTVEGGELHFWPIPDQAYKVVIDYAVRPTKISAGTDVVQIPDSHTDILVWGLAASISFRERDWDAHNFARQMYAELFAEMLAQYGETDRQNAKHVVTSGWFAAYDVTDPWLN